MMAARQGSSDMETISHARENPRIPPEDTAAENGECLENRENINRPNNDNQLAVLDAIQHLSAEMASMKHDLARLETSKRKRKRQDSSDDSELNTSDEERVLASSDDSHVKDNPTPSIDTRIKSLIANKDQVSAVADAKSGDLLGEIALELKIKEQTGMAVNNELAAIVDALLAEKLPDAKLQAKVDLYPRPDNVKGLKTPRVSRLIWQQLASSVKTYDSKQQRTQTVLLGSVAAMLRVANLALETRLDKTIITTVTDAVALALQCHHDLNALRRFHMKKELHDDYAALCNASTPASDELFGDLTKLTKDIQEANKVAKKVKRERPNLNYASTHQRYTPKRRYNSYNKTRNERDFRGGRGKKDRRRPHNNQKQN